MPREKLFSLALSFANASYFSFCTDTRICAFANVSRLDARIYIHSMFPVKHESAHRLRGILCPEARESQLRHAAKCMLLKFKEKRKVVETEELA